MADFNFITHRLATGASIGDAINVQALVNAGVTHVIDCASELSQSDGVLLSSEPRFVYLPNGVNDDGQPKPVSWFLESIEFAMTAFLTPSHKVYAHCAAGVNRGPSTAFAIMLAWGLSPEDSEAMIRRVRPQVGLAYKDDAIRAIQELGY